MSIVPGASPPDESTEGLKVETLTERIKEALVWLESADAQSYDYPSEAMEMGPSANQGRVTFVVLEEEASNLYFFVRKHQGMIGTGEDDIWLPREQVSISWFDKDCKDLNVLALTVQSSDSNDYYGFDKHAISTIATRFDEENREVLQNLNFIEFLVPRLKMGVTMGSKLTSMELVNILGKLKTAYSNGDITASFKASLEEKNNKMYGDKKKKADPNEGDSRIIDL